MKTPRLPTPEERALWRESNRHTDVTANVVDDARAAPGLSPCLHDGGYLPLSDEQSGQQKTVIARKTLLPNPSPTTQAALAPMPSRETRRRMSAHPVEATLDLHGLTKLDAYARVQQFITQQHRVGRRHVVIITGKGKNGEVGVLRAQLPHWLNESTLRPLISAFAHARPEKGGAGVTHVLLKKV